MAFFFLSFKIFFSLALLGIISNFRVLCIFVATCYVSPIFPVYLLSVSVYLCIIFIWDMKNWCGEGCNFEIITFDYIYPFFKKIYFKNVSKLYSTKYDFNISDLLCPKPLIITGVTWLSTSLYQQTLRKIHYTDQIIYTLKYEFVCFCM